MNNNSLSVREIRESDIELITQYWLGSDAAFLKAMGADINKLPDKVEWRKMLMEQLSQRLKEKKSYAIIWEVDGRPVGHSNINKIKFAEEAYMHLHIWDAEIRKKRFGTQFIKMTLPYYFEKFRLKKLYCEPYALNLAPSKTLEKAGFRFVKEYITTPGWINFEQKVCLWEMSYERFQQLEV